ncbi:MAG: TraR/DksA C4-type zinc finger protein [Clostridiales bacterium]|nr:TraR/DksA C4-type zinc finger protein [Clostridiales bacterium]HBM79826.1 molecular chaperone DnaK [Clostridiaceae bacterium]
MDRKDIEYFKKRLEDEKADIERKIKRIDENLGVGDSLRDGISELSSYDNHPADIASETFEAEKNRALKANEMNYFKRIEDALERINNGKYGICEICGREIEKERLNAVPYANLCIDCEKTKKQNYKTYSKDRPVEEEVSGYPFSKNGMSEEDYTGYDGEDTWQELESYNSINYMLQDDDEDENMQGVVEKTDKISNEQYKRQL